VSNNLKLGLTRWTPILGSSSFNVRWTSHDLDDFTVYAACHDFRCVVLDVFSLAELTGPFPVGELSSGVRICDRSPLDWLDSDSPASDVEILDQRSFSSMPCCSPHRTYAWAISRTFPMASGGTGFCSVMDSKAQNH
jgi:hypothetical protein